MKKTRVAVLYGGRSGEHEISLRSAASVVRHLDRTKFEPILIAIDKQGRWSRTDLAQVEPQASTLPVFPDAPEVVLRPKPDAHPFDVVFPIMHGPLCEDGTIQGLLELADIAYVGCGVLASAAGMDKEIAKRLARDVGLPIVPYVSLRPEGWKKNATEIKARIGKELGYPVFVKPANMGSSVGVHKVKEASALDAALKDAFRYDEKVLVEKAISAREVEVSVLENSDPGGDPLVSVPGEINPSHEFYSYEAKYLDENGASLLIPAKLTESEVKRVQAIGREAFLALECEGLARVDMFLDRTTGELYFNEVNTMPGFTSISMYQKMWEASGIGYKELLTRLIELALARHARKKALVREFHGN
jgi:D-alanine-D-alanine ligase